MTRLPMRVVGDRSIFDDVLRLWFVQDTLPPGPGRAQIHVAKPLEFGTAVEGATWEPEIRNNPTIAMPMGEVREFLQGLVDFAAGLGIRPSLESGTDQERLLAAKDRHIRALERLLGVRGENWANNRVHVRSPMRARTE